jgi:hypothetical protein
MIGEAILQGTDGANEGGLTVEVNLELIFNENGFGSAKMSEEGKHLERTINGRQLVECTESPFV